MKEEGEETTMVAPNLSFSDMRLPKITKQPVNTRLGKIQRCKDLSKKEIWYLFFMLISILTASGFTIYRLCTVEKGHPDITFGILLLVNLVSWPISGYLTPSTVFSALFLVEGVFRERPSEILMLTVAMARLIIACIFAPVLTVYGLCFIAKKYFLSEHLIFRTVGAKSTLHNLYRNLLYFQDGLKLDFQLGISLVVLVMDLKEMEMHEEIILGLGIPMKLAWFILGYVSYQIESKLCACIFWALSPIEIAYIIFKMYDVTLSFSDAKGLASATIVCIIVAFIARVLVIILSVFVYRGFGKGLKAKLKKKKDANTAEASNINSNA